MPGGTREGGNGHGRTGSADGRRHDREELSARGARRAATRPAIREKKFGIWQPTSWREWLQISRDIAYALHATGFRPGDVASIMANAVPEWVFADMGILCAGGVSSGIYPTDSAAQVEYLVNDSRTRVIFAEDEEQLDKVLTCRSRCPTLQRIVVFDMEGLSGFSDPMVMSLAEFIALGRNHAQGREALWEEMIASRACERSRDSGLHLRHDRARPRARCTPTAASCTRCATPTICIPAPTARNGWCSCRSAMSPSGSAATTSRSRWDR